MSEKKLCEVRNCHIKVVERVSSKGKKYKALYAVINGKDVMVGFCDMYTENALLRVGVHFDE